MKNWILELALKLGIFLPWHDKSIKAEYLHKDMRTLEVNYQSLTEKATTRLQSAEHLAWYEENRDNLLKKMKAISDIESDDYHEIVAENEKIAGGAI